MDEGPLEEQEQGKRGESRALFCAAPDHSPGL